MKRYIISIIVGLFLTGFVVFSKDAFHQESTKDTIQVLVDGFFVSGALLTLYGGLVFTSNEGAFDMLKFGIIKFFDLFKTDLSKAKYNTFYDYRVERMEKKQPIAYLLLVGLGFLAISMILLIIYYNM